MWWFGEDTTELQAACLEVEVGFGGVGELGLGEVERQAGAEGDGEEFGEDFVALDVESGRDRKSVV